MPVEWIVDRLTDAWGEGASWVLDSDDFPHEDTYLRLDCRKIKSRLGWHPALELSTALDWIVEWYKAHRDGGDLQRVTLAQIDRYSALRSEPSVEVEVA